MLPGRLSRWQRRNFGDAAGGLGEFACSLVGCMLRPHNCDRFTSVRPGANNLAIDFRQSYNPYTRKRQEDSPEELGACSYLAHDPPAITDRLLLLHAESQIGKTGAYLALIRLLRAAF